MYSPDDRVPGTREIAIVRVRLTLALAATTVLSLAVGAITSAAAAPVLGIDPISILAVVPIPQLSAATGLLMGTTLLTAWMLRQVIRPAEELEAARQRMGELYEAARSHALEDSLTRLQNHRAFQEEFDRQLEYSKRYNLPLALLLIDLDDFKLVNDSAGHAVGDELLIEMGRLLTSGIRRPDRAFRTGGDEFAVIMPHTNGDEAYSVARRLLVMCIEARAASPFPRPFSFSAGISSCPASGVTRSDLFAQADAAVYDAKRHGRTAVRIFDPTQTSQALDRDGVHRASALVARVVTDRALRPVYQPIVDLATGRIVGYEGLVRPEPGRAFANAGELFAVAEAAGRSFELDQLCVSVVAAGARDLQPDLTLSFNLSPRTIEAPEFNVAWFVAAVERHGIDPSRATIELTERQTVEDVERLRTALQACQSMGVRIAADDVGAGNAGLRLLSQIHFDIVKIDLSLVHAGARREPSLDVLRSLTDLAARWGALVVAEGVETPAQLKMVREIGIRAGQGYLLGRPAPVPQGGRIDLAALEDSRAEPSGIWAPVPT